MIITGMGLRFAGLNFLSIDMHYYILGWYDKLAVAGFTSLREPFSNYTPPYLYLLFLITKTAGLIPKISAIKLISICFDLLNAFLIYKLLKIKYAQGVMALIGATFFLLLPTVLLNSAYWGQSDAIYTFFLLACIFFLMTERPLLAVIFLAISFSFKPLALFLGPFVLLLIVRKKISWFYLGIVPLVYTLMMIPAALAGRPLIELLTIYGNQAYLYRKFSMHAPNLYLLVPNSLYNPTSLLIGAIITTIVTLGWTTIYARKIKEFTPATTLFCALVSVAFVPFFLPKMHDRYFYLAEVLSFLVAFYFSRGWLLAVGYQLVSGLTYSVFLTQSVIPLNLALARNILITAALVNTALMGFIFWKQWKLTHSGAENRYTLHLKPDIQIHDP
jgi:Gpi18-like mannosyltransferase